MDSSKELIAVQRTFMLDENNFGHWKVRMKQRLKGIEEDVWTAVKTGWSEPTVKTEGDEFIPKPKETWTDTDKLQSKHNSKAISEIFNAINPEQFKLVQGCVSAKDAWDTLVDYYEGTSTVKRTRLDHLAAQFENLRMSEDESITVFSAKLSAIAHEATVLGKEYKDKKLVKKMIRCLPEKFANYKPLLKVGMNTDDMKFSQLVGILKAEDMDSGGEPTKKGKDIAFAAEKEEDKIKVLHDTLNQKLEDSMGLLARNFKKALRKIERGQGRSQGYQRTSDSNGEWKNDKERSGFRNTRGDGNQSTRKRELQCHECEGYGHIRSECPLAKRKELKCSECKGFGHVRCECPSMTKKGERSMLSFSDTESEGDDDDDRMMNLVAFIAEESDTKAGEESESDDEEIDPKVEYRKLYDNWVSMSNDNLKLLKDKAMLEAQVNILEMERSTETSKSVLLKEKRLAFPETVEEIKIRELESKVARLGEQLSLEEEKNRNLESNLSENHKRIRMLNTGTKELDKILGVGQSPSVNWGLGYCGKEMRKIQSPATTSTNSTVFVRSQEITARIPAKEQSTDIEKRTERSDLGNNRIFKRSCNSCGQQGHIAKFCYERYFNIRKAWKSGVSYPDPRRYGCVWVPKSVLYARKNEEDFDDEFDVICDITQVKDDRSAGSKINVSNEIMNDTNLKCFMSRFEHKEETVDYLTSLVAYMSSEQSDLTPCGGKVTFGDGAKGSVRGVGDVKDPDQPDLVNVFYVEGLKANLISISQLCDEGLKVWFSKTECQAIDDTGKVTLEGIRSGNNCYMWRPSNTCLSATDSQLDLWHKRMGHMNVNGMQRIVKANVVRGVPKLEEASGSVCKACCQGKQIKVQHKQVKEITSKRVLELVHLDLMGPIQTESIGGRRYIFVLVDDFSRFTWVRFLREKI
ncbi:uncharacterized protein LOC130495810 [Raphanus sativus]|uniref:Uncharacterized protein LOC130495810 n=1 Tax=Raphanus sativus TaxID=3726 RepID=A0A9W3BVK5_RAPSA|nr:uncharacterized protein LOC130495810 [Raphanus sativus]